MDWLRQLDAEKFLLFTLVLARVSGLTMTAPIYGTKDVPFQVRGLLAVALALLLAPSQWHVDVAYPGTTLNYLVFVGAELLIGLSLGLGIVILFSGVQLAGQLVGRIGGMMLADVFDPATETEVPMFSRLLFLVTLAVFVCIGGHRMVMAGLLDTFQTIPPGSAQVPVSVADAFVTLAAQSFDLGLRAAVPVVTALLLSTLVLGLISRTLPQLNILMVGFGLNALLTFAIFSLTIGVSAWVFQDQVEPALDTVLQELHAPLRTEWLN
jgi:flagellar biosynthesis protein FliR